MTATRTVLQGATLIDFTGSVKNAATKVHTLSEFGPQFVSLVRAAARPTAFVVVDRAIGLPIEGPVVIRDHVNLTGTSPLVGPNDESGDRFPVVQGIYIADQLSELPRVLAAGLKPGVQPAADDTEILKENGISACCYNAVPAMLIAAHARCQILAILLPPGQELPARILKQIDELTGAQ
jgi:hypothetical protein